MFKKSIKFISIPTILLTPSFLYYQNYNKNDNKNKKNKYSLDEVAKHNTKNDIWVTYYDKVYDVTNFINHHPGGSDYLMMAAGSSIAPYWNL